MLIDGLGVKLSVDSHISLTNTLIGLYAMCGDVERASALFDQMEFEHWFHGKQWCILLT